MKTIEKKLGKMFKHYKKMDLIWIDNVYAPKKFL